MGGMRQGIDAELMLLNWTESANGGCKLIFEISADELEPFKSLRTRAGKKVAGQRFAAVLVLIDDDESVVPAYTASTLNGTTTLTVVKPVDAETKVALNDNASLASTTPAESHVRRGGFSDAVGQRARLAVQWCVDEQFQRWVVQQFEDVDVAKMGKTPSELAKAIVCEVCGISSRKELDTDEDAWDAFCGFIRSPYGEHLKAAA